VVATTQKLAPIIDGHVHVFPEYVFEHRDDLVAEDRWFGELYANSRARLASTEDLLESMTLSAIDVSVLCGFPWSDSGLCKLHNDYMAESAAQNPREISWLATVLPSDPTAPEEAARAFERGAVGIGELNADGQGFDLSRPDELGALIEVCLEYDRPIMFHTSEPVGHAYPGKGTATPTKLLTFLERFPDVRVVAAHWGGGLPFYEMMPEVAELTRNVVYDSAATSYLYRFPVFRTVIDLVGPRRVLFASDYPVLGQERLRKRVMRLGIPTDTLSLIMSENARAVYRIE
jgi:uncharacterized protein